MHVTVMALSYHNVCVQVLPIANTASCILFEAFKYLSSWSYGSNTSGHELDPSVQKARDARNRSKMLSSGKVLS